MNKTKILAFFLSLSFLMTPAVHADNHEESSLLNPQTVKLKKAPEFKLTNLVKLPISLADYQGKVVVLEWYNPDCPFVAKHYESGNMPKLQAKAKELGAVWLAIVSSAPGKQGNHQEHVHREIQMAWGSNASEVLIDETGKVGKAYGAKTTPTMAVINSQGELVYFGAIDDDRSVDKENVAKANNFVMPVVEALSKGEKVAYSSNPSYGCGVKY